jgi:DNA-binding PadR family transcriptional regulator
MFHTYRRHRLDGGAQSAGFGGGHAGRGPHGGPFGAREFGGGFGRGGFGGAAGPGLDEGHGHGLGPGGGHSGGHGGGRGGGRGLGRFFAHGDLRLVALTLIAEKPRHGYEIIKAIEDRVAGAYSPSPGVVYPTLTLLEDLGYVAVTEAGGKKLHDITTLGRTFLDANRPTVTALFARMDEVGGGRGGRSGAAVFEAMDRLKRALRAQLSRADVDEAKIAAAVAALEAAAIVVEGLE